MVSPLWLFAFVSLIPATGTVIFLPFLINIHARIFHEY